MNRWIPLLGRDQPTPASLSTEGGLPVQVRRSDRARRMRLTVDAQGRATVVLPRRATLAQARAFVQAQSAWLERHAGKGRQAGASAQAHMQPDALGRPTRVLLRGEWIDLQWGGEGPLPLAANARTPQLAARLRELARVDAQQVINAQTHRLPRVPQRLSIRDQASRWGSLSGRGTLSLNWRLIMAPPDVLTYVVNHELAHLTHPNHSPAFWAEVERLMPGHDSHRRWLRRNGDLLRQVLPPD